MSRKSLIGLLCLSVLIACSDNPNAVKLFDGRTSSVVTSTLTLDQSVDRLISLFPKDLGARNEQRIQQGQNEDLNPRATWISIKRKYAAGATNPAELVAAKKELFRLSNWVTRNAQEMNTPPDGETKTAAAARLVLYMSLYVYGGPATPPPSFTPAADAVVGIVTPNAPATIVTPTLHAGVQLEAGSVAENTVIVVTQNPTPFPDNCSGPLQTRLCQYPQFYTFEMFPHKRLLKVAKFNVCHVNSGGKRIPLADHDRFRLAHAKPADPADYTPGSTIRDKNGESIEILPLVAQTFSTCTNNVYASNSAGGGVLGVMSRFARGLQNLVSPRAAYAVDVGLGGLSLSMSPFNDVDPVGLPDLAVQSFSVAPTAVAPGAQLTLSYTVKNIGTATAGSVPATVFLTPPTVEGPPPVDRQIGSISIPSLAPGAAHTQTDVVVTIPQPLPPGQYRISLVVGTDPAFPDADPTNNSASAVLSVSTARSLGTLPGDDGSVGLAINDAGHAVGFSSSNISRSWRPFIWINGQITSLGDFGGHQGEAYGINNNDEVVGSSNLASGESHAFLWKKGTMTDLGTLLGTDRSVARGINSSGQIVGYSYVSRGTQPSRAWIWQNGVMTELGGFPGGNVLPAAINDAGQVVGWLTSFGIGRAWIWQNGSVTFLASSGHFDFAWALNNVGVVVGGSSVDARELGDHALRWLNGAVMDLGALPGDQHSLAEGIDAGGRVVGLSYATAPVTNRVTRFRAFFWESGHMIDLGTLGGTFGEATGINASGQIVGQSTTADGKGRATIWQSPPSQSPR